MSETTLTSPSTITPLQSMLHENYSLLEFWTFPAAGTYGGYTGSHTKFTVDASFNLSLAAALTAVGSINAGTTITATGAILGNSGVTGKLGNGEGLLSLSNSSGAYAQVGIGRTASEIDITVVAGANQFVNGSAAGDTVVRTAGGKLWLSTGASAAAVVSGVNFLAAADNANTLGGASNRWSVVYSATGSINTSDARDKTTVEPMSVAEIAASKDLAREVGTFRWLSAVAEKDSARTHVGMTVQRAIEIMSLHGLDPMRYAFICHDAWPESVDEPAGDRYSFRTDQLNLFIARGMEARIAALEAR